MIGAADLVGENPDAAGEDPEVIALFRDLKGLEDDDREIIKGLMEQLKRRRDSKQ